MGNCQAIDNVTIVIQHPNGRADKLYSSVSASQIMKTNPGHFVALLLTTTTLSHHPSTTTTTTTKDNKKNNNIPLRITRIKLLRPTDTLLLGHVYRLVTTQEVMKGLWAKKYGKKKQEQGELSHSTAEKQIERLTAKEIADLEVAVRKYQIDKTNQIENNNQGKQERSKTRTSQQVNSVGAKSRAWQPKLQSITEAAS